MKFKNKKVNAKKTLTKKRYNTKKRIKCRRRCIFLGIVIATLLVVIGNLAIEGYEALCDDLNPFNKNSFTDTKMIFKALKTPPVASDGMSGAVRQVTMYTSEPRQTDSTPCIGANSQDVCVLWRNGQNTCATNNVPFGTVLQVEGLGDCLVTDRMNSRYQNGEVDWYNGYDDDCLDNFQKGDYCPRLKEAIDFGRKNLLVIKK